MRYTTLFGAILLGGGIALVLSSFLVEFTIFSDDPGLGFRQIMGIVTGSGAAIAGTVLIMGRREKILALKILGIVFLIGGSVIFLGSLFIDLAGFCTNPGFGLKQIAGTITGAFVMAFGGFTFFKLTTLVE